MKREVIITLIVLLVPIIIVFTFIYFGVGKYFYGVALDPKLSKPFRGVNDTVERKNQKEKDKVWLSEKAQEKYITSTENGELELHSYSIKNEKESDVWVVAVHGYMGESINMVPFARKFYERGYNVLLPDLRGHGDSEGDYIGMGWHDRLDLVDWSYYLSKEYPDCKIILMGVSMGASAVMMTTGEDLPANVKLAISDCGYTSAWDEFKYQLKKQYHLPAFPVLYAANRTCKKNAGYSLKEASAVKQLKKSNTPTLFIHGDEDDFVPFEMLDEVYDAADCEKEKLIIEGAGHTEAATKNPELYWSTVDSFIAKYL
ncbi:MAG: alpha/beta hydrolase [Clostridia bacterium]|nr:alpha/beta hydrolase [Clostridia bacterium]